MKLIFTLLLFLLQLQCSHLSEKTTSSEPDTRLSVMQGLTTASQTILVVLEKERRDKKRHQYFISDSKGKKLNSVSIKSERLPNSYWFVNKLTVTNLQLEETYTLSVKINNQLQDERVFKTVDLHKETAHIAVASCMDDSFMSAQKGMWQALLSNQPDYIFLIGDNVYADHHLFLKGAATPHTLWTRYIETRTQLEIFKTKKLTPILATWDDHDFGANNSGANYKYKKNSLQVFKTFYAQPQTPGIVAEGPGISMAFRAFKQNFIFIDNRFFRVPAQTHWGSQQEAWVMQQLKSSSHLNWLIQGDQFFGGYHTFESFEKQNPANFKKVLQKIASDQQPSFFLSGDRHLTELMKIQSPDLPYTTYEFTSSGIHAFTFPNAWAKTKNPRQIEGRSHVLNFAIVEIFPQKHNSYQLKVRSLGKNNSIHFEKTLNFSK